MSTISIWSSWYSRYEIWAIDMGDDSIDMVILHIDMGYPVTLIESPPGSKPNDISSGTSISGAFNSEVMSSAAMSSGTMM